MSSTVTPPPPLSSTSSSSTSSSSAVDRTDMSTSKKSEKLRGTFGKSLNEKLQLVLPSHLGEGLLPSKNSSSSSSGDGCCGNNVSEGACGSGYQRPLDVYEEVVHMERDPSLESSTERKDSGVDPGDLVVVTGGGGLREDLRSGSGFSPTSTSTRVKDQHLHRQNKDRLVTRIYQSYELEDDALSPGFLCDMPSGLVDIEGNIIGEFDIRFGLDYDEDEDELSSVVLDDDRYDRHNRNDKPKEQKKGKFIRNSSSSKSAGTKRLTFLNKGSSPPDMLSDSVRGAYGHSNSSAENCLRRDDNNDNSILYNNSRSENCNNNSGDGSNSGVNSSSDQNYYHHPSSGSGSGIILPQDHDKSRFGKLSSSYGGHRRRRSRSPHAPLDRHHSSGATSSNSSTITQHYYPEGGWGFVILVTAASCQTLLCGMQLSYGILMNPIFNKFGEDLAYPSGWLGALSLGISLFLSPVWVSICKRKSTRLSAVFGGLVASLGCLFTSFASQFHQLFVSYGAFLGVGVGLTRDASSLMVGQYFKRKRELVEIVVVSGSGIGIVLMSVSIHSAIGALGWRLGLQAVTGSLFLTFFLSTCYRSASLYHPQRRAILHLKNQKRKVKEKEKREEKPPFIDYSCLRSKTLQILLLSSAFNAFGMYNPLFSLALECSRKGFEGSSLVLLHVYVGTAWVVGSCLFGILVIQKSQDCRVSKQYLAQVASIICSISILAFTSVKGNSGMVIFAWVYGFSLGGYNYALKVYTYERVRARHFPRAWSFVQSVQALPLVVGVPLTGNINQLVGWKSGYYLSALVIFIGACCLFLTDVRRRRMSRRKASQNSSMKTCETTDGTQSPKSKRLSFSFPIEQAPPPQLKHESDEEDEPGGGADPSAMMKELTCISEEGIADMDFQDIYFEEWAEYFGDCITSCGKVENCLVSEYDPDLAVLVEKRARRWSAARQSLAQSGQQGTSAPNGNPSTSGPGRVLNPFGTMIKSKGKGSSVLGVPMLNPKLFQLSLGNRSQNQRQRKSQLTIGATTATTSIQPGANDTSEPEGPSPSSASTSISTSPSLPSSSSGVMRAVPFFRSHIMKGRGGGNNMGMPPPRSFSVIDEDSV